MLLLVTYGIVCTAAVSFAGIGDKGIGLGNRDNSDNVFLSLGPKLFGDSVIGHILLVLLTISILTSASASTQTTILPTARTSLSMAVYKAIPEKFARIHPKFLTPTWSTIAMGIVSIAFYADRHVRQPRPADTAGRLHRFDDRVLLRAHRVRLRLVLSKELLQDVPGHHHEVRVPAARWR